MDKYAIWVCGRGLLEHWLVFRGHETSCYHDKCINNIYKLTCGELYSYVCVSVCSPGMKWACTGFSGYSGFNPRFRERRVMCAISVLCTLSERCHGVNVRGRGGGRGASGGRRDGAGS